MVTLCSRQCYSGSALLHHYYYDLHLKIVEYSKHKCVFAPRFRNGMITRPRTTTCRMFFREYSSRRILAHVLQRVFARVRILARVFEGVFVRGRILVPCFERVSVFVRGRILAPCF